MAYDFAFVGAPWSAVTTSLVKDSGTRNLEGQIYFVSPELEDGDRQVEYHPSSGCALILEVATRHSKMQRPVRTDHAVRQNMYRSEGGFRNGHSPKSPLQGSQYRLDRPSVLAKL